MALLTGSKGDFVRAMLSSQPYKPGQGSWARHGTLAAAGLLIVGGMYSWMQTQPESDPALKWGVPVLLGIVAGWMAYRLVHYPRFADFLISTEAEMNKVSWPGYQELKISTVVVLATMVLMAVFLFVADSFWKYLLYWLGILKIGGLMGGGGAGMFHVPPMPMLADMLGPFLF